MRPLLFKIYWWLEARLVPGLRPSQYAFAEMLEKQLATRSVWLEVGCGRAPFPWWMPEYQACVLAQARWVVGIDLDMSSLRDHQAYPDKLLASGYALPFPAESFELISANMVVEHLHDPAVFLREARRVLKPAGRLMFHTTNRGNLLVTAAAWTPDRIKLLLIRMLEGRSRQDVFRTHYRLNRRADIERLALESGLRLVEMRFVSTSAVTGSLGPLAIFELLWLRMLARSGWESWRTNIICILEA